MDVSTLTQFLAFGLSLGAVYALVAVGFVVIYRASQVFNFAHGELLTFGAFSMVLLDDQGLPWGLALLGAMTGTGLLAALVERVALRPLVGRPVFVTIMATIFIGIILRILMLAVFGTDTHRSPTPWDDLATLDVGPVHLGYGRVGTVIAGAIAVTAFFILIRRSRVGVAMRAAASDQEAALALGIPVGRIFGFTWFLAGALAALGGIFLGMYPNQFDTNLGFTALRAFPAVIIGGLESVGGAVIAGLALGVLEALAQGYVNPRLGQFGQNFHEVFPYLVMIIFLVIRPYGIFGVRTVRRL